MNKLVAFVLLLTLLAAASSHANNPGQLGSNKPAKSSRIVYIDVEIIQLSVEDCYDTTNVPDLLEEQWIRVYPNPNDGSFQLELGLLRTGENVFISMYDLSGRLVFFTEEIALGENLTRHLNPPSLQKGVYMLHVQTGQRKSVQQLIIL